MAFKEPVYQSEEERLAALAEYIDQSFVEPDPYFRELYIKYRSYAMWLRVTILQGGEA